MTTREPGESFTLGELRELGPRGAVDHALASLVREGVIENVSRGHYVRPRVSRLVGLVPPSVESIVHAVASASQAVVEVHGVEAARQFGLTTQVSMHPMYVTSERSRTELTHLKPPRSEGI